MLRETKVVDPIRVDSPIPFSSASDLPLVGSYFDSKCNFRAKRDIASRSRNSGVSCKVSRVRVRKCCAKYRAPVFHRAACNEQ